MFPRTEVAQLSARRRALSQRLSSVVAVVHAGDASPRNYAANIYPFRASSHFLYLVGKPLERAVLVLDERSATLFAEEPDADDALWHGARPTLAELQAETGCDEVRPLSALEQHLEPLRPRLAALLPQDAASVARVAALVGRPYEPGAGARITDERDALAADAIIGQRLVHDLAAQAQLRAAARASAEAHMAGMRATRSAQSEGEVCAAIVNELRRRGMDDAYNPIVTVHGEVLHSHSHENALRAGDLLLCDVGGESPEGWASDITRTWPTSGRFSPTQRAIYNIVLDAQLRAIDKVRPGVRYRDVHEAAKRAIVEGLCHERVLKGDVDGLLARGAANLFFPHGIGHLIGLDVHDMEDLGDRAGYAPGRSRSDRFGDRYLRLDRDLVPGMAVTIEPGFYQVPAILSNATLTGPIGGDLDRERLAAFADVRGIRIEDDVLCTQGEPEVLSSAVPKRAELVEALLG